MIRTPTYYSWAAMRTRCLNPKYHSASRYAGRGISHCPEWSTFAGFLADMGERPDGTSLDRIDNSLGYCKANCRWATKREQANNRSNTSRLTFRGECLPMSEWERRLRVAHGVIRNRIRSGWSVEKALSHGGCQ